jgi:hypothetical protein
MKELIGKNVLVFCMNYIYTGKLITVNASQLVLEDGAIVYDTGGFSDKGFLDAQKVKGDLIIGIPTIESVHVTKKVCGD